MSKVSIYPHIKEVEKSDIVELKDVFDYIKSDYWSVPINEIRTKKANGIPKKEIEILKQALPYFTGSGIFNRRNEAGLVQHNGRLVIDFDEVENTMPLAEGYEVLSKDQYTEYLSLSCTGTGYFLIVKIDPENHYKSFLFLKDYYKQKYNLPLDKGCHDVSRPRYISYDPNLYHNPDSATVVIPTDDVYAPVGSSFDNSISIDTDEGKYQWCKAVHEKKQSYIPGNRHNYIIIFAFFLNKAGVTHTYALNRILSEFVNAEKGADEYTKVVTAAYAKGIDDFGTFKINKSYEDMPPEYVEATKQIFLQANSINRAGRIFNEDDIRSFSKQYDIAQPIVENIFKTTFDKNKDEFGLNDQPDIYKVEIFIKKRWEILKNEVTHRTEGRLLKSGNPINIINIDQINRELMHAKFKFPLDKLKSLLRSEFIPLYNPFKKYFENLSVWDQQTDHISNLANHIETDNQDFWVVQFKKALVRNIACSVDLRVNRIIMTLVGEKEETGKSSFIEFLCPPNLKNYYTESPLDNTKDSEIQLSENFIWNLEELAALNALEINKLKAIISKISVKQRAAYKEFHEVNPRRVNFWAATNKTDFLTDDQNTRWLCFGVKSINFDYNNIQTGVKNVDINQVWAQAWHLYKNGFEYRLTASESLQRANVNKEYESISFEREIIQKLYKPAIEPYGVFMTNAEIMVEIGNYTKVSHKSNIYAVARAMKQLGFTPGIKKVNGKTCRGYKVEELTPLNTVEELIPTIKP